MWPAVKAMLHSVYDEPDAAAVPAQFGRRLDHVTEEFPAVAEHLDTARADILAFTSFPKDVWTQIWSKYPSERLNREIHRRTDFVGILPTRDAIFRLVGSVPAEQADEWAEGRRYLDLEILGRCCLKTVPNDGTEVDTDTFLAVSAWPHPRDHRPLHHYQGFDRYGLGRGAGASPRWVNFVHGTRDRSR